MSKLETAQRRLDQAVRRLEAALARRMGPPGDAAALAEYERVLAQLGGERDHLASDLEGLRGECDRLSIALSEAQRERQALRQVTEQVASRLDGSIAEIDRLLEN
jgi:flagellar export protein FliJ